MTRLLPRPTLTLPPVPALLASMLSIQSGAAIAKGLFPVLGPSGTTLLRVGLGALLLLALVRPPLLRLSGQQWRAAAIYGAVLGLMNLSFYASIQYIPLGLAVAIEFMGPLGVAVYASRRAADLFWVALAAAGIVLISPLAGGVHIAPVGLVLALIAAAFWAAYIVLGAQMPRHFTGTQGVSVGMLWAALTVVVGAGLLGFSPSQLSPHLVLLGLGVAVLSSALPYSLEMIALRQLPKQVFSILMSLEPVSGALMGFLILGERLSALQIAAMTCIVVASAGATLSHKRASGEVQV